MKTKLLIILIVLAIPFSIFSDEIYTMATHRMSFNLIMPPVESDLLNVQLKKTQEVKKEIDKPILKNEKIEAVSPPAPSTFNKNSHNPRLRTVWREFRIRDGRTWWWDEDNGVYWRYLDNEESPNSVPMEPQAEPQYFPMVPMFWGGGRFGGGGGSCSGGSCGGGG